MNLTEQQIRQEIRSQIKKIIKEVRGSVDADIMINVINRLPDALRAQFPEIGYTVIQGGKEIRPFDLVQTLVRYPSVYKIGNEINFGMHLGDSYRNLLPTREEIAQATQFISHWLGRRGWYIMFSNTQNYGQVLTISALPKHNEIVSTDDVLYHMTDLINVDKIKKQGLVPRGSIERGFPPRIYLFTNRKDLEEQLLNNKEAWEDSSSWHPKLTKTPDVVVIEIDKNALRKGTKFEIDPEFYGSKGHIYTRSHIPPEAIIRITKV